MHTWRQKFLTWLLVSLMLSPLLPSVALASSQVSIPLDQAIQTVKQNFIVPPEYTTFNSGFNESQNRRSWSLNWSNPTDNGGNFSAQVDAGTGEIISMNCWKPETPPNNRIPSISLPQAQEIGIELLQRLVPNRVSSLTLIPDSQLISLTSYGRSNYTVRWQRMVNNIPVLGEGAHVQVSSDTGQVMGYNLNWSNINMPSPAGVISPDSARQTFLQEAMIQLQYMLPNGMGPRSARQKQSPLLVYRVDHPSNGVIDALTGKAIVLEDGRWIGGGGGGDGMYMMNQAKAEFTIPKPPLTPQEKEEIDQTSGLISQEAAAAAIKKWVDFPASLALRSANLEQDWRDPNLRIWNLSWSSAPSPASSLPSSASALPFSLYGQVSARTGELLGFNLELPQHSDAAANMSQEAAQNLADNFLKQVQAERFLQLKLDAKSSARQNRGGMIPGDNPTTWHFNYLRTVNGISFPDNGANISVDRASQKISSYNLNWVDKDFPSAQGVLGLDRANDIYLQAAPLTLSYSSAQYKADRSLQKMRLVYQPQPPSTQPYYSMIDARTGEKLDEQGQAVSQKAHVRIFNDISGSFAEKEISLLGQAGLLGEYGDAFHPNENIKLVNLLRAMLDTASGLDSTRNLSDQDVMKRSLVLGWIKEALPPDSVVSRGLLSQLMVRSLALEYLAQLPEIYQLPYQDGSSLGTDLKGYAALTWGLGIIRGDGVNFDPQHTISRAEAACALVKTLGTKTRP